MAITYSAGAGTTFTTSAKNGTIKSFTGGQVRFEEDISISNNGNLVASPSYAGRLIYISGGTGVGQTRYITAQQTGQGDGGDVDIDVSEAWTTDPDGTSTYEISYIVEDADTLAGVALVARSGFWEWKREIVIDGSGTFAFVFLAGVAPHEFYDNGSTSVGSIHVASNGRLDCGYSNVGIPVFGPTSIVLNGAAGEWAISAASGSFVNFYDFVLFGTLANNHIDWAGGTHTISKCKLQSVAYQMLGAATITIGEGTTFAGAGTANDYLQVEDTWTLDELVMEGMNGFESLDDGLTETLEVRNCLFLNTVTRNVRVHDDKVWNFVNPVNLGSDSTLISFEVDDTNEVNVLFSLDITVTEPDGTAIVDADCYVYEGLLNQDLPTANRVDTDSNGAASTDVLVTNYTFPASVFTTATSGDHSLKVYEWLKTPFVTALTPDFTITGGLSVGVVLIDNPNIVQTTQATAISAGSGITIERPTNPTQLLSYDTGTIAFAVGDVVDGAGGAQGTVTEVTEGDTTSGRIHLRLRNGTAFVAGEDLDVSAVKKAQATNPLVALDFATHIDGNALSLQTIHDYWAARQAEDTISADGITSIEWGEGEHAEIVFADGGGSFRTERNVGATDGVFISDYGAGAVSGLTADDGTVYVPPTTVTLTVECKFGGVAREGIRVRIERVSDGSLITNGTTNGSGVYTDSFVYTTDVDVNVVVRQKAYKFQSIASTIEASGMTVPVALTANPTVNLP